MKAGRKKNDQKNAKGEWVPTEEQKQCATLLFTNQSNKEIIATLKISEKTFYDWFHNEYFVEYINKQRKSHLASWMPRVDNSTVMKALGNGTFSMTATRTLYELLGEINSEKEQQASTIVINIEKS